MVEKPNRCRFVIYTDRGPVYSETRLGELLVYCEEWAEEYEARGDKYNAAIDQDIAELLRYVLDKQSSGGI